MVLFAVSVNTVRSYPFVICCFKPILIIFIEINVIVETGHNDNKCSILLPSLFLEHNAYRLVLSEQLLLNNLYLCVASLMYV